MANCPKCGKKLHIYNVSQYCPECGTNMRFYGYTENFFKEAKLAELTQAGIHIKIRRLKAAFIGSKLTIARLATMLLPVIALLVPAGSFSMNLPYDSADFQISGLGLYNMFSGGDLNYFMNMKNSEIGGAAFSALTNALILYVSVALLAVFVLVSCILCFISYKNMQKITSVLACLGIIDTVIAMVFIKNFVTKANACPFMSAKFIPGLLVATVCFAAVLVVNLLLSIKGIPVEYDEGMEERTAIYKKVKSGEISIDDLPQPVVQTEATRKIDEEIAKEAENIRKTKEEKKENSSEAEETDAEEPGDNEKADEEDGKEEVTDAE